MTIEVTYFIPQNNADISNIVRILEPELGPEFRESIFSWVTDKQRPYKLEVWQVYIARDRATNMDIGIFGFYRHEGDIPGRYWIGWLGVAPQFRGKGVGSFLIQAIEEELSHFNAHELWVYTENNNRQALALFRKNGLSIWGRFLDTGLPQTAATEHSIALMKKINKG
jgi:GNAT superfamily N-acetyltransferase